MKIGMMRHLFFILFFINKDIAFSQVRIIQSFDHNWQFVRLNEDIQEGERIGKMGTKWNDQFNVTHLEITANKNTAFQQSIDSVYQSEKKVLENKKWETVSLPHTAFIEPLVIKQQWQGVCYYKKDFYVSEKYRGKNITIAFEGAMQEANVWVNGIHTTCHLGGYTPFSVDITKLVLFNQPNHIVVRLDNRDNPLIPPGKPVGKLDFNYYSGIYRDVHFIVTDKLHITDPVNENIPSGGGIFITYPNVSKQQATISVATHLSNEALQPGTVSIMLQLFNKNNKLIQQQTSAVSTIDAQSSISIQQNMELLNPELWSPGHPYLYTLKVVVLKDHIPVDEEVQQIGIRYIEFTRQEGFKINGQPLQLEGSNRHMEYPYIGNALSDNANYRDMYKIKSAGFNIVRLSHYPQDPSVYDACDALGLLVIDCTPGWQFYNKDSIFIRNSFKDIRDMIRRDRNHACVVLWEVLLNESWPPAAWKDSACAIAHQEYPGTQCYTAGDMYGYFKWDVLYNDWKDEDHSRPNTSSKPGFIREYGDYEFGGGASTSRVVRGQGEQALLQQAWNLQWSHNQLMAQYPWTTGQATWQMFDTNHGCCDDLSACGMMDIFRIPKISYAYFQSQQATTPMISIAGFWKEKDNTTKLIVYSNCDEVALYHEGKLIKKQQPDNGVDTEYGDYEKGGHPFNGGNAIHLKHPPFTFTNCEFDEVTAIGYVKDKPMVTQIIQTPAKPAHIKIEADFSGKKLKADAADVIFVYAKIVDANKTLVVTDSGQVQFIVSGPAKIIGSPVVNAEAGIATILLQAGIKKGKVTVYAKSNGIASGVLNIVTQ